MSNNLDELVKKRIITNEQKGLILEYNERLNNNNVPIIYNLRHLRKILGILKNEQSLFLAKAEVIIIKYFIYLRKKTDIVR